MAPGGDDSSERGGIRVKRETVIILSDGDDVTSQTTSPAATVHADNSRGGGQMQQQYGQPKAFRKLSNASSLLSDIFRHPEMSEDALRRKIKRENDRDTSKLIDFLRNTTPPPHNFMSLPGGANATDFSHRNKRRSFWPFWGCRGKKSERKTTPPSLPLIRLPDTAIAGRTTGGHRHIAISIPVEHAHLDLLEPAESYDQEEPEAEGKPVDEQAASLDVNISAPIPPLIPEISYDGFGSILSPCYSLEETASALSGSSSSSSSSPYSTEVGHAPINLPLTSRTLTANPKQDAVASIFSITNPCVPRLRHPRCRIPRRSPLVETVSIGSASAVSCATTTLKCCSPRRVGLEFSQPNRSPSPDSTHLYTGLTGQDINCPVCLDPATLIPDTPSISRPVSPLQQFVTARASITSMYQAGMQISQDLLASKPGLRSGSMSGSMESMLLSRRRSWQVLVAHENLGPARRPRDQGHEMRQCLGRSESYQDLWRRYQELGRRRDPELNVLLERLNGLERDHQQWMRAIVPVLEGLTRGMLARYEHCEETGFGNCSSQSAYDRRGKRSNGSELVDTSETMCRHDHDSISDYDAASSVGPGNDVTESQAGDDGIYLSGIQNIEPLMREILGQGDRTVAEEIGIARGEESIDKEFEGVSGNSEGRVDSESESGAS